MALVSWGTNGTCAQVAKASVRPLGLHGHQ